MDFPKIVLLGLLVEETGGTARGRFTTIRLSRHSSRRIAERESTHTRPGLENDWKQHSLNNNSIASETYTPPTALPRQSRAELNILHAITVHAITETYTGAAVAVAKLPAAR